MSFNIAVIFLTQFSSIKSASSGSEVFLLPHARATTPAAARKTGEAGAEAPDSRASTERKTQNSSLISLPTRENCCCLNCRRQLSIGPGSQPASRPCSRGSDALPAWGCWRCAPWTHADGRAHRGSSSEEGLAQQHSTTFTGDGGTCRWGHARLGGGCAGSVPNALSPTTSAQSSR